VVQALAPGDSSQAIALEARDGWRHLAELYEQARYTPDDLPFTTDQLSQARALLRQIDSRNS
jgi:hypothetical protein